jgi:hypothetical protein
MMMHKIAVFVKEKRLVIMTQSDLAERFETQDKGKVKLNLKKGRIYNTSVLAKILKALNSDISFIEF